VCRCVTVEFLCACSVCENDSSFLLLVFLSVHNLLVFTLYMPHVQDEGMDWVQLWCFPAWGLTVR